MVLEIKPRRSEGRGFVYRSLAEGWLAPGRGQALGFRPPPASCPFDLIRQVTYHRAGVGYPLSC